MTDSNGQTIKAGDRIVWCGKSGNMCDVDIFDKDGVLWGEGPFTEYPLSSWLSALDFDYCEIVDKE